MESGLLNNGFRDYCAECGRYIQGDPIGQAGGPSTYGYVGQNPLGYVDPLGLQIAGTVNNGGVDWNARAADSIRLVGYLLTGTNIDQYNPGGSGAVQSVVTPFEFMASGGITRGAGAVSRAMCEAAPNGASSLINGARLRMQLTAEQAAGVRMPTKIRGYSDHALQQIAGRDGGIGVNRNALLDAWFNPHKIDYVPSKYGPTFRLTGNDSVIVVNQDGKVVTGWAKSSLGTGK